MVADSFPMFRFATLMARQLSAPLALRIKSYAVSHPRFGSAVCVRLARVFQRCEWGARVWALRLAGTSLPPGARAPPLPTRTAISLGGELIVFVLGSLIIIFEVNRQAMKQEDKKANIRSQWLAISMSLEELQREVAVQQADIERLRTTLLQLQTDRDGPPADGGSDDPDRLALSPQHTCLLHRPTE